MISKWPHKAAEPKDPDAVLDYQIDWTDWLGDGETIVDSQWTATGMTVDSSSRTTTTATAWVSGGTARTIATLTNRITTSLGRTDDRSLLIKIQER